jgi:hypothetical protein
VVDGSGVSEAGAAVGGPTVAVGAPRVCADVGSAGLAVGLPDWTAQAAVAIAKAKIIRANRLGKFWLRICAPERPPGEGGMRGEFAATHECSLN